MTARETMLVKTPPQQDAPPRTHRRQVRNFALVWTGITLLVGALTFVAISLPTGGAANAARNSAGVKIAAAALVAGNNGADNGNGVSGFQAVPAQQGTATLVVPATNTPRIVVITNTPAGAAPAAATQA